MTENLWIVKMCAGKRGVRLTGLLLALSVILHGANWKVEVVDPTGPGRFTSMKIDKNGNAHVCYSVDDGNRLPLKYAYWERRLDRWFTMNVAQAAGVCSLALDSKQRPHISYADAGSNSGSKLRHCYWDGSAWRSEAIPLNSDIIAYYNSIIIDSEDRPSISFYEYRGAKDTDIKIRLRNVMFTGQYWEVRTIDPTEGSGKFNSMAIDPKGGIHVAYANVSADTLGLRYAFWNGSSWKTEIIESGPVGYSVYVITDKEGNPHISYTNETTGVVKYAFRINGRWKIEAVDRLARVAYPDRNSLAFDENGQLYMSYYDGGRGSLKVAHRVGEQKWEVQTVESNGAGFSSSIQIDRGTLWMSYTDDMNRTFKVARVPLERTQTSASVPEGATPLP